MKTIYYTGGFAEPMEQTCSREGMLPAYIFSQPKDFGSNLAGLLSIVQQAPAGWFVAINIESQDWWLHDDDGFHNIRPHKIADAITVIKACRIQRPDCTYALIAACKEILSYPYAYEIQRPELVDRYHAATAILSETTGIVCPHFYIDTTTRLEDTLFLMRSVFEQCRKHFPNSAIRPLIDPHYNDIAVEVSQKAIVQGFEGGYNHHGFKWEQADIERIRLKPRYWSEMLRCLDQEGITEVVLWMDGVWMPFDEKAEWWQALMKWGV